MDVPVPDLKDVDLGDVLRALADPHRRAVIATLAADPAGVERPCSTLKMGVARSTATHHWKVLREAGLTNHRDVGNGAYVRLRRDEFERRFPGVLGPIVALSTPAAILGPAPKG
jgi:DNA-binding transcriptional ArsR family regulator